MAFGIPEGQRLEPEDVRADESLHDAMLTPFDPAGREHRDEEQSHRQRGQQRKHNSQGHIAEHLASNALDEYDGEKDRDGGQRGGEDRSPDLAHAADGSPLDRIPLLAAPEDALQYHDGIVHQHPDSEGQPAQRHNVEGHVEQVHPCEGGHDGDRDGHADDQGVIDSSEKHIQHENRQQTTQKRCVLDLADGVLNEHRGIGQNLDLHAFGERAGDEALKFGRQLPFLGLLFFVVRNFIFIRCRRLCRGGISFGGFGLLPIFLL